MLSEEKTLEEKKEAKRATFEKQRRKSYEFGDAERREGTLTTKQTGS